jgi:hypothetical protein
LIGYEGISCSLVLSVMLLVCLWFCRLLSRSFACVCLSLACLACLCFRRRPTGIGRAGFLGREDVLADASIKGVYVRSQSFSLHAAIHSSVHSSVHSFALEI